MIKNGISRDGTHFKGISVISESAIFCNVILLYPPKCCKRNYGPLALGSEAAERSGALEARGPRAVISLTTFRGV